MKILIFGVSNIGDCILTTGIIDPILKKFPHSCIDVVVSKRAGEVFLSDSRIRKVIPYDKKIKIAQKIHLVTKLREEKYDLVFDLRNTFVSFFLAKKSFRSLRVKSHAWWKHNTVLRKFYPQEELEKFRPRIVWSRNDEEILNNINFKNYIVISPSARSKTKAWPQEYFQELISLIHLHYPHLGIVIVGEESERKNLAPLEVTPCVQNLVGKTTIPQLAVIIKNARAVITNDSAVLHVASCVNTPTLAIFGPTDEGKYGPLAENSMVLRRHFPCAPCEKAQCKFKDRRCLVSIRPEFVFYWLGKILEKKLIPPTRFSRVLLTRCDKIGDLILTTPAITAVRYAWPNAYIGFMCSKYTQDILENNPDIDEVIPVDKKGEHRGMWGFLKLVIKIRSKRFDVVINFHPTNRVHLLGFLARIPLRVGYDWKMGFLNNMVIKHKKQRGEKSESEYNFDLLKILDVKNRNYPQKILISPEGKNWVEKEIVTKGLDKFVLIHPGASCPSKLWPLDNFVQLSEKIIYNFNIKVVFLLGPGEEYMEEKISQVMKGNVLIYKNLELKKVIGLISRCSLLISNDSGPMHIGDALGKPVITIFGRNQPGLSPRRWGPRGDSAVVLWKDVGCKECRAHNCDRGFLCLKAITVDEVYSAFINQMNKIKV